jgi:hypothetical protein
MSPEFLIPLAAAAEPLQPGRPLFGHLGMALGAVLVAIAALLVFVALLGRWLAATHPSPTPIPVPVVVANVGTPASIRLLAPDVGEDVSAEIVPVVLATVAEMFGGRARVASIRRAVAVPVRVPSIEALMQEWSHEGRRQIYSSHKVR